jgi:probable rRNA maturation factor
VSEISIIISEQYQELILENSLKLAADTTLSHESVPNSPSVTVIITDDETIEELNLRYRGIAKPTDVLAFETDFTDPDLDSRYLGDVVISFPQARKQAESGGHELKQELQLLIIHGLLHLLGYDHDTADQKEKMWSVQSSILDQLDISINIEES